MRTVEAHRVPPPVKPKELAAPVGAVERVVLGDAVIVDDLSGQPVIVQASLPAVETAVLRDLLRGGRVTFTIGEGRMSGLQYEQATFGYRPRTAMRRQDFCSASQLMVQFPGTHAELDRLTVLIEERFAELAPAAHAEQVAKVEAILPDWRIGGTSPWTAGVINNTAALAYHRDTNNVPRSWSAMLVLRRFVRGGLLRVPEYGLALACTDNALVFFCGSDLIHGVTPFKLAAGFEDRAYRLTLVWYAINRMRQCLPCEEEIRRGKRARTAREDRAVVG